MPNWSSNEKYTEIRKEYKNIKNLIEPTNPNAVTLYRSVALKAFLFSEMTRRVIKKAAPAPPQPCGHFCLTLLLDTLDTTLLLDALS